MVRVLPETLADTLWLSEVGALYTPFPPDKLTVTGPQLVRVTVDGFVCTDGQEPAASPVKFTVTFWAVCPSEIVIEEDDGGAGFAGWFADGLTRLTVNVLPERVNAIELLPVAAK